MDTHTHKRDDADEQMSQTLQFFLFVYFFTWKKISIDFIHLIKMGEKDFLMQYNLILSCLKLHVY